MRHASLCTIEYRLAGRVQFYSTHIPAKRACLMLKSMLPRAEIIAVYSIKEA